MSNLDKSHDDLTTSDRSGAFTVNQNNGGYQQISNESKINVFKPKEVNKYQSNPNGIFKIQETNKINKLPVGKKKSSTATKSLSLFFVGSSVAGSAVVGVGAILSKDFDVSLYYQSASSLVFDVNKKNVAENDRVLTILEDGNDSFEYEITKEQYATFEDLKENTTYTFTILLFENYYNQETEVEVAPKKKFSASYQTSMIDYNVPIEVINYSAELLDFVVINETPFPFLTTEVIFTEYKIDEANDDFTITSKTVLVQDFTEHKQEFTLKNLPYDTGITISVKNGNRGVGKLELSPLTPEPVEPTAEYIELVEPVESYYVGDEFIMPTVSLHYLDSEQVTDVTNEATVEGFDSSEAGRITVTISYITSDGRILTAEYEVIILDKELIPSEITVDNVIDKYYIGDEFIPPLVLLHYSNSEETTDVTEMSDFSGFDSSEAGMILVTVYYVVGEERLTTEFEVEIVDVGVYETDRVVSYNSFDVTYSIALQDEYSKLSIYVNETLQTLPELTQDGTFTVSMTDLDPETTYVIDIRNSEGGLLISSEIETVFLVNMTLNQETKMFGLEFNEKFIQDMGRTQYYYRITFEEKSVYDGEIYEAIIPELDLMFAEGVYTVDIYYLEDIATGEEEVLFYSKDFTFKDETEYVEVIETSVTISYGSITPVFQLSDITKLSDLVFELNNEVLDHESFEVDGNQVTVSLKDLIEDTAYRLVIYQDQVNIFESEYDTAYITKVIQTSDSDTISINATYALDVGLSADHIIRLYDSNKDVVFETQYPDNVEIPIVDQSGGRITLYNEVYTLEIGLYTVEQTYDIVYTKDMQLEGDTRPSFSAEYVGDYIVTITFDGGTLPDSPDNAYAIQIQCGEDYYVYIDSAQFVAIGDEVRINLNSGSIDGETGPATYNVVTGEYTVEFLYNRVAFSRTTFDITEI